MLKEISLHMNGIEIAGNDYKGALQKVWIV